MDDATAFAISLAERVSPDDVDQAPALLKAASGSDADWARVIAPRRAPTLGGVVEGAGPAEIAALIDAFRNATSVLASLALVASSTLAIAVHRLTIREKREQAAKAELDVEARVEEAARLIGDHLARHGIDGARAEEMARAALEQVARDTQRAQAFLARLGRRKG